MLTCIVGRLSHGRLLATPSQEPSMEVAVSTARQVSFRQWGLSCEAMCCLSREGIQLSPIDGSQPSRAWTVDRVSRQALLVLSPSPSLLLGTGGQAGGWCAPAAQACVLCFAGNFWDSASVGGASQAASLRGVGVEQRVSPVRRRKRRQEDGWQVGRGGNDDA